MSSACLRRINREILLIQETFPEYEISEFTVHKDKTITLIIYTPNYNRLDFTIPHDYPFKPPLSLTINGTNYRYKLKNMPKRIDYLYYHPNKLYTDDTRSISISNNRPNCLCCTSLLCSANWSPVICLTYILKEINIHNDLKRHIMYILRLKEIFDFTILPLELFQLIYEFL